MNATFSNMTAAPEPEDYTGEDGLLYCGKCRKPKESYFPEGKTLFGRDRHPAECDCQRKIREERQAAEERRRHLDAVEELKRRGFPDQTMRGWTFENDNGQNPQTATARRYVEEWEREYAENLGCLFWGSVGTGKSYLAGCIANALMEKEIPVYMTNFAAILNDLAASFEGRNEYISRLCRYHLLIIDDFGMERGTEYGLEQVYNVIDSRYRSGKPLIVTTNLTLQELQHPKDTAHARIYDHILIEKDRQVIKRNFCRVIIQIHMICIRNDDQIFGGAGSLFISRFTDGPCFCVLTCHKQHRLRQHIQMA